MSEDFNLNGSFSFENQTAMSLDPVWRNIYTVQYSQNLFDDLVSPGKEHVLFDLENATSEIDHSRPKQQRVFQYGNVMDTIACFDPKYFASSRFTAGDFGVFYGALEEITSIKEIVSLHSRRFGNNMSLAAEPVIIDRKMFICSLSGIQCADLRPMISRFPDLLSESYDFCHKVGFRAKREGIDFLVTQSVRHPEGSCVAAFKESCITGEKFQYFFQLVFVKGRSPEVNRSEKIPL